jgi:hypothetical protein
VSQVDHAAIRAALDAGESQQSIARRLGYGVATVNREAKRNGFSGMAPYRSAPKSPLPDAVVQAAEDYALERRISLLNKVFDKAESMIDTATSPHKLQALAIAVGILIDKRRLEDGEVTARTEVNSGGAREQIARRLDELAGRRREKAAS